MRSTTPHIQAMDKTHPYADATYRVVRQPDASFWAEVTIPGQSPAFVTGFATAVGAEAWIDRHKQQVADYRPPQRWRERQPKKPL